jgi:hypothetical protein
VKAACEVKALKILTEEKCGSAPELLEYFTKKMEKKEEKEQQEFATQHIIVMTKVPGVCLEEYGCSAFIQCPGSLSAFSAAAW